MYVIYFMCNSYSFMYTVNINDIINVTMLYMMKLYNYININHSKCVSYVFVHAI